LLSPAYKIRFPNRALLWKYILQHSSGGTIEDGDKVYQFTADPSLPPTTIVSKSPIPFSETPIKTFKLTIGSNDYYPIANASPERISSIKWEGELLTCSEINLNY
jgi:hypothetical protein